MSDEERRTPQCRSLDELGEPDCDRPGVHVCLNCGSAFCSTHVEDHPHKRVFDHDSGEFIYRQAWGRP